LQSSAAAPQSFNPFCEAKQLPDFSLNSAGKTMNREQPPIPEIKGCKELTSFSSKSPIGHYIALACGVAVLKPAFAK